MVETPIVFRFYASWIATSCFSQSFRLFPTTVVVRQRMNCALEKINDARASNVHTGNDG